MNWRIYLLLAALGLMAGLFLSVFQTTPGYMDAEYYYAGGLRLAQGFGFSEEILWNYLADPQGLPNPSHGYWMPLVSILTATGMWVAGHADFAAARLVFLLLAACLPPLTAAFAYAILHDRAKAVVAGLLAVFSALYFPYLVTTDAFSLYMLFASGYLLLLGKLKATEGKRRYLIVALIGALAGLMHLTRADGLLWLLVAIGVLSFLLWRQGTLVLGKMVLVCCVGYLLVMGPWLLRNFAVFGAALAPGGTRALWLLQYNEMFIYPADVLTFQRWWRSGLSEIMGARLWALGQNLQTVIAVQGAIFLSPLIIIGSWRLRRDIRVQVGLAAWLITFFAMTLIFPYQGARGGFFHSGAALQPLFWTLSLAGLDGFVDWAGRLRRWNIPQARRVFQVGLIILAIMLSGLVFSRRVIGDRHAGVLFWEQEASRFRVQEQMLASNGADPQAIVMVNNSPGYFAATGRPALSIPYGDSETVLTVANRYGARYLLLEFNQLTGEDDLYTSPGDRPGLNYIGSVAETQIYALEAGSLEGSSGE